jgi:hypothetical protein
VSYTIFFSTLLFMLFILSEIIASEMICIYEERFSNRLRTASVFWRRDRTKIIAPMDILNFYHSQFISTRIRRKINLIQSFPRGKSAARETRRYSFLLSSDPKVGQRINISVACMVVYCWLRCCSLVYETCSLVHARITNFCFLSISYAKKIDG